jgi:hypothetical protein
MERTRWLRSVAAMVGAAAVLAACGDAEGGDAEEGFPEGTYRMEITREQLQDEGVDPGTAYNHAGTWTLTFIDEQLVVEDITEAQGTQRGEGVYCVEDGRVALGVLGDPPACGDFWTAGWTLEGDQLRFVDVESGHGSEELIVPLFGSQPFTKIG